MDQTLAQRPHPLGHNTSKSQHATGQYRGMLMHAPTLIGSTNSRLPTAQERP